MNEGIACRSKDTPVRCHTRGPHDQKTHTQVAQRVSNGRDAVICRPCQLNDPLLRGDHACHHQTDWLSLTEEQPSHLARNIGMSARHGRQQENVMTVPRVVLILRTSHGF